MIFLLFGLSEKGTKRKWGVDKVFYQDLFSFLLNWKDKMTLRGKYKIILTFFITILLMIKT